MTKRNEPTLTALAGTVTSMFKQKRSHVEVMNDALDMFTKAEVELNTAISLINEEVSEEARIAREAEERMKAAQESGNRLQRTLQRLKAITE